MFFTCKSVTLALDAVLTFVGARHQLLIVALPEALDLLASPVVRAHQTHRRREHSVSALTALQLILPETER